MPPPTWPSTQPPTRSSSRARVRSVVAREAGSGRGTACAAGLRASCCLPACVVCNPPPSPCGNSSPRRQEGERGAVARERGAVRAAHRGAAGRAHPETRSHRLGGRARGSPIRRQRARWAGRQWCWGPLCAPLGAAGRARGSCLGLGGQCGSGRAVPPFQLPCSGVAVQQVPSSGQPASGPRPVGCSLSSTPCPLHALGCSRHQRGCLA